MKTIIIIILLFLQASVYSQVPPPPFFLGLDDSTSLAPKLLWSKVPATSSYGLQISTDPMFIFLIINQSNIPDTFYQAPAPLTYYIPYYLRLNAVNSYGTGPWSPLYHFILHPPFGIKPISTEVPDNFTLYQNYPNPFNPVTTIKFDIPATPLSSAVGGIGEGLGVRLVIYNILGREIAVLVNEPLSTGTYEVTFNVETLGRAFLPSGVYFYRLAAGDFVQTRKMVLLK